MLIMIGSADFISASTITAATLRVRRSRIAMLCSSESPTFRIAVTSTELHHSSIMNTIYFDSNDDEATRRQRLYDGQLYVYSPTESSRALCHFAREMCEAAFAPHFPPEAQHHMTAEAYSAILRDLKPAFIHHPECKKLIPALLEELGCQLQQTYFDVPRLRTACAGDYLNSGLAYAFKPHRDTWYSAPQSQLNWWLPIYPIESERAMAFHPEYWHKPIQNSSSLFNYQNWNVTGRKDAAKQIGKDLRVQPELLEPVRLEPQTRVATEPGGVIVFSAAQMHSTVPNSTQVTRFSIDFRTVDARDVKQMRGAPNLDSESTGTTMSDYLCCTDLSRLPEDLIQQYLDLIPSPQHPTPQEQVERAMALQS